MKNYSIVVLSFFFSAISYGQFQNSQQQSVLTLQNGEVKTLKINGGETSLEWTFPTKDKLWAVVNKDSLAVSTYKPRLSANKIEAVSAKIGILNVGKFVDLDKLDFEDKGVVLGISYINSFNQAIMPDSFPGEITPQRLTSIKAGLEVSMDNFDRYDPVDMEIKDSKPITVSLSFSGTRFYFDKKDYSVDAFSLNVELDPITYDKTEFGTNFKRFEDITNIGDQVVSFKDFDGKFGRLENNVSRAFLGLSYSRVSRNNLREVKNPKVLSGLKNDLRPYVIPVYYITGEIITGGDTFASTINGRPKANAGIALGFTNKPIFGKEDEYGDDKTEKEEKPTFEGKQFEYKKWKYRAFQPTSLISLGVDWSVQSTMKPELNFFLSGTIAF
ncbi:MAG: hypothetical protein AAGL34_08165 [Bacteroidota bacterium]